MPPKKGKKAKKKLVVSGNEVENAVASKLAGDISVDQSIDYSEGGADSSFIFQSSQETPRGGGNEGVGDSGSNMLNTSSLSSARGETNNKLFDQDEEEEKKSMNSSTKGDRMSFSNLGGEEAKDDQRLLDSPDRFNKEENDD